MIDSAMATVPMRRGAEAAPRARAQVHLGEYPVFFGALAATLTEVYEPLGLNDNLTIPLFTSIALQWGFARISSCGAQPPLEWLKEAWLALR